MIGKRIRELRDMKQLSRKDLAKVLGVTERTIGFYESEERNPPIDILNKLADIFDVSVDYLLGRTNIPNLNRHYHKTQTSDMYFTLEELEEFILSKRKHRQQSTDNNNHTPKKNGNKE
ncbi:helix-turn-helix domain-containing protein [Caldicoprobacter algeriensis]|uniref:helix-turn-helix domain-containing protein n=1 Tax=Caldicoprobacter algeriensis TaxID=699281 RepID=UPI002079250E|nr:helix-turn-helix transcriptional regulator [Caldicoprobacter algeriensis]MCM8901236.1 helix-turn-helix domain-containing protein [Caldicoprobacter algeriensis]